MVLRLRREILTERRPSFIHLQEVRGETFGTGQVISPNAPQRLNL